MLKEGASVYTCPLSSFQIAKGTGSNLPKWAAWTKNQLFSETWFQDMVDASYIFVDDLPMNIKIPCVVFVMIDGLRPDAITADNCPNLFAFKSRSAFTLWASSIMPSMTLPCHMSIFHSVPPARHGVTTNTWVPMARPLPGLVEVAKMHNLSSAFFYNWEPLRNLSQPGNLSAAYFWDTAYELEGDGVVVEEAMRYIPAKRPNFAFVYIGTVDTAGHYFGWMSSDYLAQITKIDGLFGQLMAALPTDSAVLVQSDHGGHERTHGTDSPEDMTIPWMVAGPGIRRGHELKTAVSLLDTAPTLAHLLGVPPHPEWEGQAVGEIYANLEHQSIIN